MSLNRYSHYRGVDIQWLGEVPSHWRVKRLRALSSEPITNGVGEASDLDDPQHPRYIRITDIQSSRRLRSDSFRSLPPDIAAGAPLNVGDLLFAAVGATYGKSYFHSKDIGPACFAGYLVRLRPSPEFLGAFASYWAESAHYWAQVDSRVIQSTVHNFSASRYRELVSPVPPLGEQEAIAAFLDHETAKIDTLVEEQRRLIELLKEKRQAVISRAVTKGLDPNVPMKESGDQWTGTVPAHWTVCALRRVVVTIEQGWSPECEASPADDESWGVLKAGCVNRGVFDPMENKSLPQTLAPVPELEVHSGDILVSRASGSPELVGSTALVGETRSKLMLSDKIFRVHLTPKMTSPFFVWTMNGKVLRDQIERALSGGNGMANNLPQGALLAFVIAVPPVEEQRIISTSIEDSVRRCEVLIAEANRGVDLLLERRSALVSAAVTGKIDVRSLASRTDTVAV